MTKSTKTQDEILRAARPDGIFTPTKAAKAVVAMTKMAWLTSEEIPESGHAVHLATAGFAAIGIETQSANSAPAAIAEPSTPETKIAVLVDFSRTEASATDTGRQAHSVRSAVSGSIKKLLGLAVASEKTDGLGVYRIVEPAAA